MILGLYGYDIPLFSLLTMIKLQDSEFTVGGLGYRTQAFVKVSGYQVCGFPSRV